jgi:AAA domain, putative AbiEii toxin, Type IV TA system/AAA domain
MYITSLTIRNIRSIEHLEIDLADHECPGWHVILGANGAGKSSVIRSIALTLIGPKEAVALRQSWDTWQRQNAADGSIEMTIAPDKEDYVTNIPLNPDPEVRVGLQFRRNESSGFGTGAFGSGPFGGGATIELESSTKTDSMAQAFLWGPQTSAGWFAASFGPFRRFSGGDRQFERVFKSNSRLASHLSAFGEDVALTEGLQWLQTLRVRSLESSADAGMLLDSLMQFLNRSDLLPHGAKLTDVKSEFIVVTDAAGAQVSIEQMSDGYRSILSMIFEILRQMAQTYGVERMVEGISVDTGQINLPGIICIDEIDAHLHPSWQRDIGPWFTRCFPRLQFFVTTHSPIICRSATSVWRLPEPGSGERPARVAGTALQRLIYGSILDAYGTGFFGDDVARSEESKEKLEQLAKLNRKALRERLSQDEDEKLTELRAALPTVASDTAVE